VLDLKKVGLYNYARHPSTDVWCMAFALGDEEPAVWHEHWTPDKVMTATEVRTRHALKHVEWGGRVVAHNAPFELDIWNEIMVKRYGWPELKPEQTYCTMAMAYAMSLPGALEDVALALGLDVHKDTVGRALMLRMARPRSFTVGPDPRPVFWDDEDKLARLYAYCKQDVVVEREVEKRLLPLSAKERRVWLLDYKINQRGVAVDVETATAAINMAEVVKEKAGDEINTLTGGDVQSVTALAAIKDWCRAQGVAVTGLAKQDVNDLLDSDLPYPVRRALVLRQEVGKASASKLDRIVDCAAGDGRLRNLYQYHGAGTGRWAGRGVQVHNLPRDMPDAVSVERILSFVRQGNDAAINAIDGAPLTMISRCLRSFFVAPPGKVLISGDWANIEGRGQAWFAGEEWKLDAFRAADAKTGPGIYELAYSRMFGVPVESVKNPSEERQVGKVSELAFGYAGGKGSFHVMAKTYGVKVSDEDAEKFKDAWRDAHPKIAGVLTSFTREDGEVVTYRKGGVWNDIERAAIDAVLNEGVKYTCGEPGRQATYVKAGSFLWCRLPSGRVICYPYPKILPGLYRPMLTYMAVPGPDTEVLYDAANASNWKRTSTYGGSLFNNIVQGFCRDFLADGLLNLDAAGAAIVLHTHDDENIEVDEAKAERARAAMEQMMVTPPAWAAGFPLHAECKIMKRYGK
jgi:DNA polymerase